ncbi:MAG: cell wall-binding repeat-containing protein [Erysipelotrichaceae bacterium]|nr:cell wall-binding repeat-containing protein [Erysipelotrichaceae bacterium]
MKRFWKILLCLLLVLTFAPPEEAKAEGEITGIHTDLDGVLYWDEVSGTEYYTVEYVVGDYTRGQTDTVYPWEGWPGPSFPLKGQLMDLGYPTGNYMIMIRAYSNGEVIAAGSYGYFPYASAGKMAIVTGVYLDSTYYGHWDDIPKASYYIVTVYRDGTWWSEVNVYSGNEAYLGDYMIGEDYQYSFTVKARRQGYEDSDHSSMSNAVNGAPQTFIRLSGSDRYETSRIIASTVRGIIDDYSDFDSVFVATGEKYPDALSGAFLANILNAPLLMISGKSAADTVDFINNNLKEGGRVYILGGEGVLKPEWLDGLDASFEQKRLSGKTRYLTNLKVLEECAAIRGYKPQVYLVCTGENFADSLSCSALSIPMILVKDKLNSEQKAYLEDLSKENTFFYIIGGTKAVPENIENELAVYGTVVKRVSGSNRYETSALIGRYFQEGFGETCVIATGKNFPDGLSAGPLAYQSGAALLLVKEGSTSHASEYNYSPGVRLGYIAGGKGAVSDQTAMEAFNVSSLE